VGGEGRKDAVLQARVTDFRWLPGGGVESYGRRKGERQGGGKPRRAGGNGDGDGGGGERKSRTAVSAIISGN